VNFCDVVAGGVLFALGAPTACAAPLPVARADAPSTCPSAELRLVTDAGAARTEVASMRADGSVRLALARAGLGLRLDGEGCLRADPSLDGAASGPKPRSRFAGPSDPRSATPMGAVWVDASTNAVLWTEHEIYAVDGDRVLLENRRSFRIRAEGGVEMLDEYGAVEPSPYGSFAFEPYAPAAACAARVLMVAFLTSMPSMAVSDGRPPRRPPPAGSRCVSTAASSVPSSRPP
jgi:hypothetical protein